MTWCPADPAWLNSDEFDIVAKASQDGKQPSDNELRHMLQALLTERFKLAIHKEEKVVLAYVLSVGKRGAKFKQTAGGDSALPASSSTTSIT